MTMRSRLAVAVSAWLALSAGAAAGPNAASGASLYDLESKWATQDGASVALSSFAGKPVILAMGYTTCKDICPAVVANMMWIEKHLPSDAAGRVRFAFFSFDSEADTPERLRLYAGGHGLDLAH
jgi:protein SCO1/2